MADITMCNGTGCPYKNNCKRALSVAEKWQSWGSFAGLRKRKEDDTGISECNFYIKHRVNSSAERSKAVGG